MPYFVILILSLLISVPSFADAHRKELLREQLNNGEVTRLERIGQSLSGACACSGGESLEGTQGLLFNCICGSMQCVVVGSGTRSPAQAGDYNLFCR